MGASWQAHLRAALIGLALIGHGIYALPLPDRVTPSDLKGIGASELDQWHRAVQRIGWDISREELGDRVVGVTAATAAAHAWMKTPFRPLFDIVGANQAWGLFAAVSTTPERLVVDVRDRGSTEWRTILRRLDPCCTWYADPIRYRRIRGVWDSQHDGIRPAYNGLTRWLAARAFAEFPEIDRVRVRIERGHSTYPWEPLDPKTTFVHAKTHLRRDFGDPRAENPPRP